MVLWCSVRSVLLQPMPVLFWEVLSTPEGNSAPLPCPHPHPQEQPCAPRTPHQSVVCYFCGRTSLPAWAMFRSSSCPLVDVWVAPTSRLRWALLP